MGDGFEDYSVAFTVWFSIEFPPEVPSGAFTVAPWPSEHTTPDIAEWPTSPNDPSIRVYENEFDPVNMTREGIHDLVAAALEWTFRGQRATGEVNEETGEAATADVELQGRLRVASFVVMNENEDLELDGAAELDDLRVRFGVRLPKGQPALSREMLLKLNPLLLTVLTLKGLPNEPWLAETCEPVRVNFKFWNEEQSSTSGREHAAKIVFEEPFVFFVGEMDHRGLRQYLQTDFLRFEVHDRELKEKNNSVAPYGQASFSLQELVRANTATQRNFRARTQVAPMRGRKPPRIVEGEGRIEAATVLDQRVEAASIWREKAPDYYSGPSHAPKPEPRVIAALPASEVLPLVATMNPGDVGKELSRRGGDAEGRDQIKGPYDSRFFKPADSGLQTDLRKSRDVDLRTQPEVPAEGASISLRVQLARPLPRPAIEAQKAGVVGDLEPRHERFSRVVLILSYKKTTTLKRLISHVVAHNCGVVGMETNARALATRELTEEEKANADFPIFTGFIVMDRAIRLVVVEGLRANIAELVEVIPRTAPPSDKATLLYHEDVGFSQRLYTPFDLTLKQIKLRSRLEKLLLRPTLYDQRMDPDMYGTFLRLEELRVAKRVADCKRFDFFPTAKNLTELETQYGDFVTRNEMEGGCSNSEVASKRSKRSLRSKSRRADTQNSRSGGPSRPNSQGGAASRSPSRSPSRAQSQSRSPSRSPSKSPSKSRSRRQADGEEANKPPDAGSDDGAETEAAEELQPSTKLRLTFKGLTVNKNPDFERALTHRETMEPPDYVSRYVELSDRDERWAPRTPRVDMSWYPGEKAVFNYSSQRLNIVEAYHRHLEPKPPPPAAAKSKAARERPVWRYPPARKPEAWNKVKKPVTDARREELAVPWEEEVLHKKYTGPPDRPFGSDKLSGHISYFGPKLRPDPQIPPEELRAAHKRERAEFKAKLVVDDPRIRYGSMENTKNVRNTLLDGEPVKRSLNFAECRRVAPAIARKYGEGPEFCANVEPDPVTIIDYAPRAPVREFHAMLRNSKDGSRYNVEGGTFMPRGDEETERPFRPRRPVTPRLKGAKEEAAAEPVPTKTVTAFPKPAKSSS